MMITTTLNRIRGHDPCKDRWEHLLSALGKTTADDEPLPYADIVKHNGLDDALWCCRAEPQYAKEWRLFAVWCARQVQFLMKDKRSIEALNVAERYAHGQATDKELDAARDAAWAARDAAWDVARDAAWAAWDVARDAAWDAAWAAGDAAWAAGAVERAAARATARDAAWAAWATWDVAWDVARDSAWDVARDAAWDAAWDAQAKEFLRVVGEERKSFLVSLFYV